MKYFTVPYGNRKGERKKFERLILIDQYRTVEEKEIWKINIDWSVPYGKEKERKKRKREIWTINMKENLRKKSTVR